MGPKETLVRGDRRAVGFTLLELLVVVVIIGLLAGFVAPRYFGQVGKSIIEEQVAATDLGHDRDAACAVRRDHGRNTVADDAVDFGVHCGSCRDGRCHEER